ncbi:MAG: permease prefix domain 1-containing protein [Candidatus Sumerlaeia bacterium]
MELPESLCEELRRAMPGPHEREPRSLRRDIEDELADHLACSIERERARGLGDAQARAAAIERFGNPGRIARKLWMQAMKEHIMRDRLIVAVNILLAVVIIFAAVMVYRISEQSRQSNLALVSALERIGKAQAAPAVNNMANLTIKCTRNTPDGPPAKAWLKVYGEAFNPGTQADLKGQLDSSGIAKFGPMRPGSYGIQVGTGSDPGLMGYKAVVLYAGDQRDETIVVPDVTTATATVSFDLPDELKAADIAVRLWLEYEPLVVNDMPFNYEPKPIVVTPSGKLYMGYLQRDRSIDIFLDSDVKQINLWAKDPFISRIDVFCKNEGSANQYLLLESRSYNRESRPVLHVQPGMNRLKFQLPQNLLEKVRLNELLVKSGVESNYVDQGFTASFGDKLQRILPVDKDAMILKYLPDWNHGDVDNICIANNDGGVRTLLSWPDVPLEELKPGYKYLLAMYSRKTTYRFTNDADTKGAIAATEINANWTEDVSWKTQPPTAKQPVAKFDMTPGEGWKVFDVTPIVLAHMQSKTPVRGIMLHFINENLSGDLKNWSGYEFVSREGEGVIAENMELNRSKHHPMLLVVKE